jgi:hypothetical protein
MGQMPRAQRFLVKMRGPPVAGSLAVAGTGLSFRAAPLFSSIQSQSTLGMAAPASWHILEPTLALDAEHPWDVCHNLVVQGLGIGGGQAVEFAEPDFEQQWLQDSVARQALAMTASCDAAPQDVDDFPGDADPWWYQDNSHGQFRRALEQLGDLAGHAIVRIAHLDTGYDPDHESLPEGLERELQRNFVDPERPRDAADRSSGLFNNLGHGTGTLGILAGAARPPIAHGGAAPFARVVPLRVANRVEIFHNSAVAQAFDYVHQLCASEATAVQVLSMSLGGLASQAWAEAVNALYEAGVVLVTAAGNNYDNLPTHNIVFPARFRRVIAACGVMANHAPYANLAPLKMAGNYGPASKMRTALAAWTPNVPWARWGCPKVMNFDGRGTSAATPQVAAAVAIWLQRHKAECDRLPAPWMRVEAARRALFGAAGAAANRDKPDPVLGMGELRAFDALQVLPDAASLVHEEPDSASFGLLRVLTGFGITAVTPQQQRMLELEALQLSQSAAIEALLPDPERDPQSLTLVERTRIAEALAADPRASRALRTALQASTPAAPTGPARAVRLSRVEQQHLANAIGPKPPTPIDRRIRVYAYDPSLGRSLETVGINQATLTVVWESELAPGPVGEYVEVVDVDPASACCYAPVDLNDPRLLANDGLGPSETNPQFHQQMVYAVSMTTIAFFEKALGRVALWSSTLEPEAPPGPAPGQERRRRTERYVQRLRIYPHALRDENAYYSPERRALLLGYFSSHGGEGVPSELVFAALSHDIVAHETSHALLDGLHRRFREPTNPDVLAFHEAFADIVALFQHFSLPDSLRDEIARAGGDLSQETMLAKLAVQFGEATGHYGALRDYIGSIEVDPVTKEHVWKPLKPSRDQYASRSEAHDLGAVLVAAVFDAFLKIYKRRAQEPILLATGGSGVLPPGALPAGLADALTAVASKVAAHVLTMCIRGLDYCPPIDITFGDYLRAVITADRELVPKDPYSYRVAFVSAFAERGIFPRDVRSLSVETILWEPPPMPLVHLDQVLPQLDLRWDLRSERFKAWSTARSNAVVFRNWLLDANMVDAEELETLGLKREPVSGYTLTNTDGETIECDVHGIEVHSVRPSRRVGPDGQLLSQAVVEITQGYYPKDSPSEVYRAGVTLVIDLPKQAVVYLVRKRADLPERVSEQQQFRATRLAQAMDHYAGLALAQAEPFQFLHRGRSWRAHGKHE